MHSESNSSVDHCSELSFDSSVYRLDAVKKAAYKFADSCSAMLRQEDSLIIVSLEFKESMLEPEKAALLHAFKNEVLDQQLREEISEKTESVRNLILAQAFSKTSLVE